MFKLDGWKKDPHNDKDFLFEKFETKLIKIASSNDFNIIPEYTPVSNQGRIGSCVANSTIDALEILMGIQDPNSVKQLSRLFTYYNSRNYTQDTKVDEGTFIRYAFQSLMDFGTCLESTWEYDPSKVFLQPSITAYKEASDNTIEAFYRIDSLGERRIEAIIKALSANHPVVFGTGVSKEFTESLYLKDPYFTPPKVSIGNHAMIIVGYNLYPELKFYIRNSWGKEWGDNGHCWMSKDYITDLRTQDLWVPTLVPEII